MSLSVFALNTSVAVTLTDLTRAEGSLPQLPPLADWLGLDALDTDRIELFPIQDLGELSLSQYLEMAHVSEAGEAAARLNALSGQVLLVPETAMSGTPNPGAELTLIARLDTAQPDHAADLPKADIPPIAPAPATASPMPPARPLGWIAGFGLIAAALLIWGLT